MRNTSLLAGLLEACDFGLDGIQVQQSRVTPIFLSIGKMSPSASLQGRTEQCGLGLTRLSF